MEKIKKQYSSPSVKEIEIDAKHRFFNDQSVIDTGEAKTDMYEELDPDNEW